MKPVFISIKSKCLRAMKETEKLLKTTQNLKLVFLLSEDKLRRRKEIMKKYNQEFNCFKYFSIEPTESSKPFFFF